MALGSATGRGAPYGAGRYMGGRSGGAARSPQHFLVNAQLNYIGEVTRSFRAAELLVIPKRSRTYFGPKTPKTAARIASGPDSVLLSGEFGTTQPGGAQYNFRRVRETLLARARLFRSVAAKPQRVA